ncbi:MAG: cation-binding protein [Methyloceanibacter sp.]|nr:MAG: cation-binding protein [Methyloceanibacter sp.]
MTCPCLDPSNSAQIGAIQVLRDEHRVIEEVLDARLDRHWDAAFFRQSIDFLGGFADGCHHAKEEKALILESAGISREGGPIGCMLSEHETGRDYARVIGEHLDASGRGDTNAARSIHDTIAACIATIRVHVYKEDDILSRLAEDALGREGQELMDAVFDRSDRSDGPARRRQQWID